jgi:hypothetical protein
MKSFKSHLRIPFFFGFLFFFQILYAADDWPASGAQSFGMGNIRAVGNDYLNPAAISFSDRKAVDLSVLNRFQMSELNTANLSLIYPDKRLDAGFRLSAFGYEDYRIAQLQGSFAKKIRKNLSLGIQVNYRNTQSRWEEDSQACFSSGLGVYYRLNEQVDLALLGEDLFCTSDEKLWRWQAGLQYHASDHVALFVESGYDKDKTFRFVAGIDYALFEQFHFRSGYDSDHGMPAFGVGYGWNQWQVDVGFSFHSVLGTSSAIGIRYQWE